MANPFCLIPQHADAFLAKVKSGELSGEKLSKMTSEERRAAFADVVGEANAAKVNASFESRLLLKNQQAAIKGWIDKAGDLTPAVKRDLLSRVDRMDAVLHPKTSKDFLADIAKQRLGFGVTAEEAGKITALAKGVSDAMKAGDFDAAMTARAKFNEYTGELKGGDPMTLGRGVAAMARFAALTWPTTVGKLLSAAFSRAVLTPVEDLISTGAAKALPGLAEGAERTTSSLGTAGEAEAAAQSASWTKGLQDAGRLAMNKPAMLDLMHGKNTAPHAWYEYAGSLHAALKSTTKWAEYGRALYRRTAAAGERGEDINDMTVKMRLSTEAYGDAERAVQMQDNKVASAWNAALKNLEAPSKATGKPNVFGQATSAALQTEVPIIKAPTNIAGEALAHIAGLPYGAGRTIWAYMKGIEDLKPVERDMIFRHLSKGSIGAAFMLLAYFKRDAIEFGGFYQKGEHRKPGDVPAGGVRIFGHDLPKVLAHLPLVDAMQFAATTGRVYGTYNSQTHDKTGFLSALGAAALGLAEEIPIIGTMVHDVPNMTSSDFVPGKIADITVPGAIKWVAKQQDTETRPRNPKGLKQHLEANIPGLRENVPVKHPKY